MKSTNLLTKNMLVFVPRFQRKNYYNYFCIYWPISVYAIALEFLWVLQTIIIDLLQKI